MKADDCVREHLGEAPAGHVWITVWLQPSMMEILDAFSDPNAVANDESGAALVRTSDNRVVEVWRSGHHVGACFWIRGDHNIPSAQRAIDHGKLISTTNPESDNDWVYAQYMKGTPTEPHSAPPAPSAPAGH